MICQIDYSQIPILLVIGFAIFAGTLGARLFQRLHAPQVLGYIFIGFLIGQSVLGLVDEEAIKNLLSFNFFALGLIGFMIGGELHRDIFKKHGRQFFAILLSEGLTASVLVSLLITAVSLGMGQSLPTSLALGLVFGAIASATAPAATSNVLWEHKTRGILTTTVLAIVALDDALALALFAIASSMAAMLTGQSDGGGLAWSLGHVAYELGGATALGVVVALGLNAILRKIRGHDGVLPLVIGAVALIVGISRWLGLDIILAAMALGATITNIAPRRSNPAFQVVERFSPPIYVLFFVIAGARLNIGQMPAWAWLLAGAYFVGRIGGKVLGADFGVRISGGSPVLRKYLGMCLFSQAGVAVGLSILASVRFGELGAIIITTIAVTTFAMELLGPICVKAAVKRAGEVGLNVTEEDLMNSYTVAEMTDRQAPSFTQGARLADILHTIAATDATSYPVVDADGRLTGIISLPQLKETFASEGLGDWLVAFDLMGPVPDVATPATPLADAVTKMTQQQLECLPVIDDAEGRRLVGLLELRRVNRRLSQEVLHRQQRADSSFSG